MKIQTSDITITLAARQTPQSEFSHWEFSDELLIEKTANAFNEGNFKQGYRKGVVLVSIESQGLFSGITTLNEKTPLEAKFEARIDGEEPRLSFYAKGNKTPAKNAYVVLYHADVLKETNERTADTDWEIISVNASQFDFEPPIQPTALIYNHLELSGGTSTKMTDEEFVKSLKESMMFWKDKALTKPSL